MTNDFEASRASYRAHNETHLSESEALHITRREDQPELAVFVAALGMRQPVLTADPVICDRCVIAVLIEKSRSQN